MGTSLIFWVYYPTGIRNVLNIPPVICSYKLFMCTVLRLARIVPHNRLGFVNISFAEMFVVRFFTKGFIRKRAQPVSLNLKHTFLI